MVKIKSILALFLVLSISFSFGQTIIDQNGKLQVIGLQLSNEHGNPIQLRGMSSHGLQWYGNCVTQQSIQTQVNDWGIDIFRIAMYVEEGGYNVDPAGNRARIEEIVQWCTDLGIYVMIDWHILADGNPNQNKAAAIDFFDYFSDLYKNYNNVLYEVCNEPNGNGDNAWSGIIKPYAEDLIDVIRANDPKAIVMVGTPKWSSKPGDPGNDPITGSRGENVMYSFHFYAGSHYTQAYVNSALTKVPVFVTEWGTSHYSGEGGNDYVNAQKWIDLFGGQNDAGVTVSWCNWSYADKAETSAALESGACYNGNWNSTSESGAYVKKELLNPSDVFLGTNVSSPVFVFEPRDVEVAKYGSVHLTAQAIAGGDITYIWKKDGEVLPGENQSVLTIDNFEASNAGSYSVVAVFNDQSVESSAAQVSLSSQQPFNNQITQLPGRLEVENYDEGGAYLGYRDLSSGNEGNVYRFDDVDIQETSDTEGDYNIGWIEDNEYLQYTVQFSTTGQYDLTFRVASTSSNGNVYLEIDGQLLTDILSVPETFGNQNWEDLTFEDVIIKEGVHILRLTAENGDFGINYIDFELQGTVDCNGDLNGTAVLDDCGVCGGDNSSCTDCFGVVNGDAVRDNCGECGGDGSTCTDCAGVYGGGASLDDCGICSGGQTGIEPNTTCIDCNGDVNGTAAIDDCNVCSGGLTGIARHATCTDCEGILNGNAVVDDCGVCTGGTTGQTFNESCTDCDGVVNGTSSPDECGVCNGDGTSCSGTLTPYKGLRHIIPTKIETEDYDAGGYEVGFYDSDDGNNGNKYRFDDVDIDVSDDGGYAVGWLNDGEWLKYSVNVKYSGNYTIRVRCGTPNSGKTFDLILNGNTIVQNASVPNTGSYASFDIVEVTGVNLSEGNAVLEFVSNSDGYNMDWFEFVPEFFIDCEGVKNGDKVLDDCGICGGDNSSCTDCNGELNGDAYYDNCEVCVGGNTNKTACQIDCNGDWGGSAEIDACMRCAGGNTGRTPTTNSDACVTGLDIENVEITIGPNPFASTFNIECSKEFIYRVYSIEGLLVVSGEAVGVISLGGALPSGVYVIEVIVDGVAQQTTLVK